MTSGCLPIYTLYLLTECQKSVVSLVVVARTVAYLQGVNDVMATYPACLSTEFSISLRPIYYSFPFCGLYRLVGALNSV